MMGSFKLVTIYRSQGMLPAQVIKGKLESAGIPVFLKYESAGLILGLTVDGLGLVEVQVPPDWVEDATAVIAESPVDALADAQAEDGWQEEPAGEEIDADPADESPSHEGNA